MLVTDFDEMEARRQAEAAEVRHTELAAPIVEELHATHEAVASLDFGVEHQMEAGQPTPPEDFAQNPLIVDQQEATRLNAMHAIR